MQGSEVLLSQVNFEHSYTHAVEHFQKVCIELRLMNNFYLAQNYGGVNNFI